MKSRQQARWEPGGLLGPLLAPPHSRYTLWRCALAPAILSECMYFLAGFLTENREGGELETSVFGASLSPQPLATPPREETSCRLRCKPRGLTRCLSGSPGPCAEKQAPLPALTYLSET